MSCQSKAGARVLHHPQYCVVQTFLDHALVSFQRALGWGTACTDSTDTGQRASPISSLDAAALYGDLSDVDATSACQLASWMQWILLVLNFLLKM